MVSCSFHRETSTLEEDTGIEGILSRLEKERNYSFGMGEKRKNYHFPSRKDDCSTNLSKDMVSWFINAQCP